MIVINTKYSTKNHCLYGCNLSEHFNEVIVIRFNFISGQKSERANDIQADVMDVRVRDFVVWAKEEKNDFGCDERLPLYIRRIIYVAIMPIFFCSVIFRFVVVMFQILSILFFSICCYVGHKFRCLWFYLC